MGRLGGWEGNSRAASRPTQAGLMRLRRKPQGGGLVCGEVACQLTAPFSSFENRRARTPFLFYRIRELVL